MANNYKIKMKDIQNKYKFKIFCAGYEYDDTELRNEISQRALISEAGRYIELELNPNTYVLTAKLKDKNNNVISTSTPIDLPLESMIVDCDYDATTKSLIITLQNGNTTSIPLGDLISGLATEEDLNEVRDNLEVVQNELNQYKTIYNVLPKVEDEGETLILDNTGNATLKMDLKGNTSQETTTQGNNLFDENYYKNATYNTENFYYYTPIRIKGGRYLLINVALKEGKSALSGAYLNISSGYGTPTAVNNGETIVGISSGTAVKRSMTFTINDLYLNIHVESGQTIQDVFNNYNIMVATSDIAYEPFVPNSPSPDYPQDVHVVSGDNTINVVGKNLFNPNGASQTISGITFTNNGDGTFTANGTATANRSFQITTDTIVLENDTYYTQSIVTISGTQAGSIVPSFKDSNGTIIYNYLSNNYTRKTTDTMTLNRYDYYLANGTSVNNWTFKVQLEKSSTATTYEPYQSQSYSVNLGTLELCKIGNYQDYFYKDNGKWYKHSEIGKVVLDGSESSWIENSATKGLFQVTLSNVLNNINTINAMANWLKGNTGVNTANQTYSESINNSIATFNANRLFFRINDFRENLAGLKTFLSNNNLIAYYVYATSTTEEVTNTTLINQLDALETAMSYKEQTNISQINNDAPFIIDATALKDLSNL